jgi:hypothetical protein
MLAFFMTFYIYRSPELCGQFFGSASILLAIVLYVEAIRFLASTLSV